MCVLNVVIVVFVLPFFNSFFFFLFSLCKEHFVFFFYSTKVSFTWNRRHTSQLFGTWMIEKRRVFSSNVQINFYTQFTSVYLIFLLVHWLIQLISVVDLQAYKNSSFLIFQIKFVLSGRLNRLNVNAGVHTRALMFGWTHCESLHVNSTVCSLSNTIWCTLRERDTENVSVFVCFSVLYLSPFHMHSQWQRNTAIYVCVSMHACICGWKRNKQ